MTNQDFTTPVPSKWKMLFWAVVIFCVLFTYWYKFVDSNGGGEPYDVNDPFSREVLLEAMTNPINLERGRDKYEILCLVCHGSDGGGVDSNGPNMCDDYFKNVAKIEDVVDVIAKGVHATSMVPQPVSQSVMLDVSAYIASLRGTTPENPQAPAGELIPDWTAE